MGHTVLFLTEIDSQNSHKMSDLGYPLSTSKWCDMLQGETSIAAEVYHIFPWIYYSGGGLLTASLSPLLFTPSPCHFYMDSQITYKLTARFGVASLHRKVDDIL